MTIAETLDKSKEKEVGVTSYRGYSAIVSSMGMTKSDELLIRSIPMANIKTERVCSSVNVGSTKTGGIDMDAVRLFATIVKETAEATKRQAIRLAVQNL